MASLFFPKRMREEIALLYAFVRIPDEYVDNGHDTATTLEQINNWRNEWQLVIEDKSTGIWPMQDIKRIHEKYSIPFEYATDFIDTMIKDTVKERYATHTELKCYMYGSAATVGRIITNMAGVHDVSVLERADDLAYAMQVTNILRDIGEDYALRGRIYVPLENLAKYGLDEAFIKRGVVTQAWKTFMKEHIAFNHTLYREADKGIVSLPVYMRRPVAISSKVYEGILNQIEKNNYDVFTMRARTSKLFKIGVIIKVLFTWQKK